MTEEKIPFAQRHGLLEGKPIYDDFPETARIGLVYLLDELVKRDFVGSNDVRISWLNITREFNRTTRTVDFQISTENVSKTQLLQLLNEVSWDQIYSFCERVYSNLLAESSYTNYQDELIIEVPLIYVKEFYTRELNILLAEENIGYHFVNGEFQRRGRAQTQKNIQRVGTVLGDAKFVDVRVHYNKARKFYEEFPEPDSVNSVKEALLAIEACLQILTNEPASKDFKKMVVQLQGNDDGKIPAPIAQGLIKLHGYRGSGKGVAHAALAGNRVSEIDAELVLSLSAAYITYLVDLFPEIEEDDIPF